MYLSRTNTYVEKEKFRRLSDASNLYLYPIYLLFTMSDVPVTPTHQIVIVPEGQIALREECYDVRIQVFHHEQGFPLDTEIDE